MLKLVIPKKEYWDERLEEFVYTEETKLYLEHSLVSISKWEAKYHKSFTDSERSAEEMLDYIKMMCIGKPVDEKVFFFLTEEQVKQIMEYINDPMTATTVPDLPEDKKKKKKQIITNELVYYWMTALNIPFECERWHFNHLMTLIKVCSFESQPEDKKKKGLTSAEKASRKARMDAARARYGRK